jgi:hypothetical protein
MAAQWDDAGLTEVRGKTPFSCGPAGDARQFEPCDAAGLAPLLGLHQAAVTSAEIRKDGPLPSVRREFSFVAVPGGGLARFWPPARRNHDHPPGFPKGR